MKPRSPATHDNRPIGVFDSGLGGLTVAAALQRDMPDETIIYLGDTARVPYGSKSRETIIRFALDDAKFLIEREVKLVVAACNTVSSIAMPALHKAWPQARFIGVVEAGVTQTLVLPDLERVVVIGTEATIASDSYRLLIHRQHPEIGVRGIACPLFVPLVEQGWVEGPIAHQICDAYLHDILAAPPDAVILGCTHYPLLKQALRAYLPPSVRIVDSAEACASAVGAYLREHDLTAAPGGNGGRHQYFVTDMPASFFALAGRFLGQPVRHVDKVSL